MSRDFTPHELYFFTPHELYLADKFSEKRGQPLRDMEITIKTADGDVPMFTEQKMLQKKFPNLGFLFDRLPDLYKFSHFPESDIDAFVGEIEKKLTAYIRFACDVGGKRPTDIPEPLVEWFHGRLDPGFYYHETNNELLLNWMKEQLIETQKANGGTLLELAITLGREFSDVLGIEETDADAIVKVYKDLGNKDCVQTFINRLNAFLREDNGEKSFEKCLEAGFAVASLESINGGGE